MPRSPIGSLPSRAWLVTGVVALALSAAPLAAQGDGFLLGTPVGSLSVRVGYDRARAGSDLFAFSTRELTLSRNDFSGVSGAADLGIRLNDRLDFVIGTAFSGSSTRSELREWVDQDDQPIEQTTSFLRVPLTASVKAYLAPRGRSVGRFAWIPSRIAPYVGAGGGLLWYQFKQDGDFVDFDSENMRVFRTTYASQLWTSELHGFAGADYTISPRLALTAEARYTHGRGALESDFTGFQRIDLSGIAATAGLSVRF